jgi:hypothetical protein
MLPGGAMERHIAGSASTSKSLAQMNKSPDVERTDLRSGEIRQLSLIRQ